MIATFAGEFLLLRRTRPVGFWQSVTGSLEPGENPRQAARRELWEETGLSLPEAALLDLNHKERFPILPAWRDPLQAWWLPGIWMVLFGCAAHAAGFFLHRGIKLLGWIFGVLGAALLLYVNARSHAAGLPSLRLAHLVMGATFGGLHLVYAAYLATTERKLPLA